MYSDIDFNNADLQSSGFALIPANTIARVQLLIRPGAVGPDGMLTQSRTSSALYLNAEATIVEGPFARRRVYTRIGFKGKNVNERGEDTYANRGRALIRGILESANGVRSNDQSERARAARTLRSLADLNALEFVAKIGVEKDRHDPNDEGRNVIIAAIGPEHGSYAALMAHAQSPTPAPAPASPRLVQSSPGTSPFGGSNAPDWAR
jgi:hypothetical protein